MPNLTLYADDIHNLIVVTDKAIANLRKPWPASIEDIRDAKIAGLTILRDKLFDRLSQNLHPVRESSEKPGTMLTADALLTTWKASR